MVANGPYTTPSTHNDAYNDDTRPDGFTAFINWGFGDVVPSSWSRQDHGWFIPQSTYRSSVHTSLAAPIQTTSATASSNSLQQSRTVSTTSYQSTRSFVDAGTSTTSYAASSGPSSYSLPQPPRISYQRSSMASNPFETSLGAPRSGPRFARDSGLESPSVVIQSATPGSSPAVEIVSPPVPARLSSHFFALSRGLPGSSTAQNSQFPPLQSSQPPEALTAREALDYLPIQLYNLTWGDQTSINLHGQTDIMVRWDLWTRGYFLTSWKVTQDFPKPVNITLRIHLDPTPCILLPRLTPSNIYRGLFSIL